MRYAIAVLVLLGGCAHAPARGSVDWLFKVCKQLPSGFYNECYDEAYFSCPDGSEWTITFDLSKNHPDKCILKGGR
jgi:hypothetical protein